MKEKRFDVLCIGFGCVDVFLAGLPSSGQVQNAGGSVVNIKSATVSPGGDALNEATVLAKLSNKVQLICAAGNDDARGIIEKRASDVGFDASHLGMTDSGRTLLSIVLMHDDGQHTFLSTNMFADADYKIDYTQLENAKIVSLASMFVPPFHKPEVKIRAAKTAKEAGAIVCADCGFSRKETLNPEFLPAFQYVDYFFPNEEEALGITGAETPEEAAAQLYSYGIKNVIVKVGKRGCYLYNHDGGIHLPAYSQVNAIDTTGAGDNFAAGFIHSLLQGKTPVECAKFATGVSAIAVQSIGASVGVQSLEQVEAAIQRLEQGLV